VQSAKKKLQLNPPAENSNSGLPGLQLCDRCVFVVFFVTSNLVTTSTKLTQRTRRLSPILLTKKLELLPVGSTFNVGLRPVMITGN